MGKGILLGEERRVVLLGHDIFFHSSSSVLHLDSQNCPSSRLAGWQRSSSLLHPPCIGYCTLNICFVIKKSQKSIISLDHSELLRYGFLHIKITFQVLSRRRPLVVPEVGSKVPHGVRQRYVNFFVEEFLKVCATVNEAFDKALLEEKAIYDRCGGKNMYLNIAVNTVKKLRNHGSVSTVSQGGKEAGETSVQLCFDFSNFTGIALYRVLKDYALTEEQLIEHGFPQPNPEKPGSAVLCSGTIKPAVSDCKVCCRCGEIYAVTSSGRHARKEECNYHSGKVLQHKVPGGLETWYSCCEGVVGSPGCQVARLHVHDGRNENIDGFVKTFIKPPPLDGNHGVFALDCEMCYTTHGLELSRVAVVDPSLHVVYDAFVKPDNEIIDYNTRFSGVTAEDMKDTVASIRDVQAVLLNLFSADTFLIGHSLPNDLFALKMFHSKIVDISVVFPHRLGLPHRRALRTLMADYLQQIIQGNGKTIL
uniref:Exonuclease domain-containing protein n=1 Tax=Varanus komodoensis TaxID=61221 RepID=A0A8D2KZ66_VARKO